MSGILVFCWSPLPSSDAGFSGSLLPEKVFCSCSSQPSSIQVVLPAAAADALTTLFLLPPAPVLPAAAAAAAATTQIKAGRWHGPEGKSHHVTQYHDVIGDNLGTWARIVVQVCKCVFVCLCVCGLFCGVVP
jgi:hypothetical protein